MKFPNNETEVMAAVARVEADVGVGEDGTTAICAETGEPYITLCWDKKGSCIKSEGDSIAKFQTEELAWSLWFVAFREYRFGMKGKIYWRKRPEMVKEGAINSTYAVYARVYISPIVGLFS